jgi:hypothetical protein
LSKPRRISDAEEESAKGACCQFNAAEPLLTEDLLGEDRRNRLAPKLGKAAESPVETGRLLGLNLTESRAAEGKKSPIEIER